MYVCQVKSQKMEGGSLVIQQFKHMVQIFVYPAISLKISLTYLVSSCEGLDINSEASNFKRKVLAYVCGSEVCIIRHIHGNCHFGKSESNKLKHELHFTFGLYPGSGYERPSCNIICVLNGEANHMEKVYHNLLNFAHIEKQAAARQNPSQLKLVIEEHSLKYALSFMCPGGYKVKHFRCAPCPPGFYSKVGDDWCSSCKVGFYQSEFATQECIMCPHKQKTEGKGALSKDQCFEKTAYNVLSRKMGKAGMLGIAAGAGVLAVLIMTAVSILVLMKFFPQTRASVFLWKIYRSKAMYSPLDNMDDAQKAMLDAHAKEVAKEGQTAEGLPQDELATSPSSHKSSSNRRLSLGSSSAHRKGSTGSIIKQSSAKSIKQRSSTNTIRNKSSNSSMKPKSSLALVAKESERQDIAQNSSHHHHKRKSSARFSSGQPSSSSMKPRDSDNLLNYHQPSSSSMKPRDSDNLLNYQGSRNSIKSIQRWNLQQEYPDETAVEVEPDETLEENADDDDDRIDEGEYMADPDLDDIEEEELAPSEMSITGSIIEGQNNSNHHTSDFIDYHLLLPQTRNAANEKVYNRGLFHPNENNSNDNSQQLQFSVGTRNMLLDSIRSRPTTNM